jgi:nitroimidazol reductase NimA-like FMN-containing flavoprotein (pyridoxamine 5'-phosphate oxidase superfamily)
MLRSLAGGIDVSICVTLLDALVLARTAFHHSVNYRSVVLFGTAELVEDTPAKLAALAALIDRVAPKRSRACRPPDAKELAATSVLGIPIAEASAKARRGPPLPDEGEDLALPYWAGVIPLETSRGAPINAPDCSRPWPG